MRLPEVLPNYTGDRVATLEAAGKDNVFALNGDQSVGTDKSNHRPILHDCNVTQAVAICKTAPVGSALTFMIKRYRAGVAADVFSAAISIAAGETVSDAVTIAAGGALLSGDYLTIDCVAVGSTSPGADVTVLLATEAV